VQTSPAPEAEVVARLRAAGCVFAEDEARLLFAAAGTQGELEALVARRVSGVPLEHILGWVEFCGLRIALEPGVFVPRRRTGFLARRAARLLRQPGRPPDGGKLPVVVDLCCGSGAVGVVIAALGGPVELHASDVDPAAVHCARRNVLPVGGAVHAGDLYAALPERLRGRIDVLAVNAPYVPSAGIRTMPQEARLHEPRISLDGGADGLDVQRRVAAGSLQWLARGGHLLIETSRLQSAQTAGLFTGNGLTALVAGSAQLDATVVIVTATGGG
jgi:release factor glutamine methyltransferase